MTTAWATPKADWMPPPPRVAIVGGGLAGLAAAVALTGRDLNLTLYESRPRLGGRAGSFTDATTGELVDHCQHIALGCCVNVIAFLETIGRGDFLKPFDRIPMIGPDRRAGALKAGPLPAPLHLAGGLFRLPFLTWGDKLGIAYAVTRLALRPDFRPNEPFAAWLTRHRQSPHAIERFWEPILVSALNESLDRIDPGLARMVIVEGLMRNRYGYRPLIPRGPLGEVFGPSLEHWLTTRGVKIHLSTSVRRIELEDEPQAVAGLTLRDGRVVEADLVILALPFGRVAAVLPERGQRRLSTLIETLNSMEAAPITGIHLWFDRPVCPIEFAATPGRMIQWVFNHRKIGGGANAGPEYLQLVVSASRGLKGMGRQAIIDRALAELTAIWPEVGQARLNAARVVTEHAATFSATPGLEKRRPFQRTPIDGLFLAGDWTATGWPATMEGAVRSGFLAAEEALEYLGCPRRLVRPNPPGNGLSRWLLGPPPCDRPGRLILGPIADEPLEPLGSSSPNAETEMIAAG